MNKKVTVDKILEAMVKLNEDSRVPDDAERWQFHKLISTVEDLVENVVNPLVCIVIFLNTVIVGVSTEVAPDWIGWLWVDMVFVAFYLVELVLKVRVLGILGYVRGPSWPWNWFDIAVLAIASIDLTMNFAMNSSTPDIIFLRLLRLTRLGRVLRLFQFGVFRELFILMTGMAGALRTLVWASIFLGFPVYTLGLLMTSVVRRDDDASPELRDAFGNLGSSVLNVFRCGAGDCSLANGTPLILRLTQEYGWICGAVYILTIMLVTFGIFNLIMATFVDNALATARRIEAERMRARLSDTERQTSKISSLVYRLWQGQNDALPEEERLQRFSAEMGARATITREVFDATLQAPEVQDLLEALDIPEDDRMGLFDVLDADGGGTLHLEEVIDGVMKLRGDPRRSDVVHVGLVVRTLRDQLTKAVASMAEQTIQCNCGVLDLQAAVASLRKIVDPHLTAI